MMRYVGLLSLAVVLMLCRGALTQQPQPPSAPTNVIVGQKQLFDYFKIQVKQISDNCLSQLTTQADWEAQRPQLRRQFFEMMGLWPLPERTPLHATVTGTVEGQGFIVEKLHFQSRPGLYVTANFYRPKSPPAKKLPTILYVCGHGNVVENGISYGSKVRYQYHPAWFATHGYNCLILDTLQLGEIEGLHHGTYRYNMWWWQSRGYTPAGVELWNGIRALDYLESRPEVDLTKIGLTGRSGGGATSWWIAAADDRIKAVAPIAGIADLQAHVVEGQTERFKNGVIDGHCDCMFFVNKYRWDFAQVAALVAPRPLLLGNSDADDIFPVGGYRRLAAKVSKVYELYNAPEAFQLLETKGPHEDTPELRIGINRFMNKYLRGDLTTKVEDDLPPKLRPDQLKVFMETPLDSVNEQVHEIFTAEHRLELPSTDREIRHWWAVKQSELKKRLERDVFSGWTKAPPPLDVKVVENLFADQERLTILEYTSEAGIRLKLAVIHPDDLVKPKDVIYVLYDQPSWQQDNLQALPAKFQKALGWEPQPPAENANPNRPNPFDPGFMPQGFNPKARSARSSPGQVRVLILPRGVGWSQWAEPGSKLDVQIRRRFALLGQTLEGQQVWDATRAIAAARQHLKFKPTDDVDETLSISSLSPLRDTPETSAALVMRRAMRTTDTASVLALATAIMEPSLKSLNIAGMPRSLREGPSLLGALAHLDMPWLIALAAQKMPVQISSTDPGLWNIPQAIAQATYNNNLKIAPLPRSSVPPEFDRPERVAPFPKR